MNLPIEVRDWNQINLIEHIDGFKLIKKQWNSERHFAIFLIFIILITVILLLINGYVWTFVFLPIIFFLLFLTKDSFEILELLIFCKNNKGELVLNFPIQGKIESFWQIDLVAKNDAFRSACGFQLLEQSIMVLFSPDIVPLRGQDVWSRLAKILKIKFEYLLVNHEKDFSEQLKKMNPRANQ